jgi:hypothetical protein
MVMGCLKGSCDVWSMGAKVIMGFLKGGCDALWSIG